MRPLSQHKIGRNLLNTKKGKQKRNKTAEKNSKKTKTNKKLLIPPRPKYTRNHENFSTAQNEATKPYTNGQNL